MKKWYIFSTGFFLSGIEIISLYLNNISLGNLNDIAIRGVMMVTANILTVSTLVFIIATSKRLIIALKKQSIKRSRNRVVKKYKHRKNMKSQYIKEIKDLKSDNSQLENQIKGMNHLWGQSIERAFDCEKQIVHLKNNIELERKRYQLLNTKYNTLIKELRQQRHIFNSEIPNNYFSENSQNTERRKILSI